MAMLPPRIPVIHYQWLRLDCMHMVCTMLCSALNACKFPKLALKKIFLTIFVFSAGDHKALPAPLLPCLFEYCMTLAKFCTFFFLLTRNSTRLLDIKLKQIYEVCSSLFTLAIKISCTSACVSNAAKCLDERCQQELSCSHLRVPTLVTFEIPVRHLYSLVLTVTRHS